MPVSINNTQVVFNDATVQESAAIPLAGATTISGARNFTNNFGNIGGFPAQVVRAWVNFDNSAEVQTFPGAPVNASWGSAQFPGPRTITFTCTNPHQLQVGAEVRYSDSAEGIPIQQRQVVTTPSSTTFTVTGFIGQAAGGTATNVFFYTNTIRGSGNIASVSNLSISGNCSVNFINSMPDTGYSVCGSAAVQTAFSTVDDTCIQPVGITTGGFRLYFTDATNNTFQNPPYVGIIVIR